MLCEKVSVMVQLVMLLPKTSTAYIVVMLQVLATLVLSCFLLMHMEAVDNYSITGGPVTFMIAPGS